MDLKMESSVLERELETGIEHQRFRFDGQGVTFDALGQPVVAASWTLGLDHDAAGELLALTLELLDVDAVSLKHLSQAVTIPAAALSLQGAAAVRLQLRPDVLAGVVKPALAGMQGLSDLLQLQDGSGRPVIFVLANFELADVTPVGPAG
jgi:hypothetical protein